MMKKLTLRQTGISWITLLVILSAFALSACASAPKSPASVAETTAAMSAEQAVAMDMESGETADSGLTSSTGTPQALPSNRKLIRTTNMEVETDQFDSFLNTLTQQIQTLGGYIESSNVSGNSMRYNEPVPRYASITARIPFDRMDGFITTVETTGNVTNKSESVSDVTLQYSDMESRKKTLSVEQDRIWALLEKTESMESIIILEQRLSEIRYELESMESQLRLYDNQVEYSTVYLNINEVTSLTPTQPESSGQQIQKGFSENAKAMIQGMTAFFVWLIASSPIWLPLVLICLLLLFFTRRHRHSAKDVKKDVKKQEEKQVDPSEKQE